MLALLVRQFHTIHRPLLTAAVALLLVDVIGRVAMMVTGTYPITSAKQSFGIIAGTVIAALFAVLVAHWRRSLTVHEPGSGDRGLARPGLRLNLTLT